MIDYREVLEDCRLEDLGFLGNWYTWERGRKEANDIREMIDRSVASRELSELFPNVFVKHAPCIILDHYPIVVDIEGRIGKKLQKAKKRFKFEAMWANEEECAEIIKAIWKVNGDASFGEKLTMIGL